MIYECANCGWRIGSREKQNKLPGSNGLKYGTSYIFNHFLFCSEYCLNNFKKLNLSDKRNNIYPHIDWGLQTNDSDNWKIARKLNRKSRLKNKYK